MEYRKRKHTRLKQFDYSSPGHYYVTIHMERGAPALSTIEQGSIYAAPKVQLTEMGYIAEQNLFALQTRYSHVKIDKYVVMPTHIHLILQLTEETAGASPRPTVPEIIGAYKSLTTRVCNQANHTPGRKIFQTSFYDSILRSEKAYQECWRYIDENPAKWLLDPEDI